MVCVSLRSGVVLQCHVATKLTYQWQCCINSTTDTCLFSYSQYRLRLLKSHAHPCKKSRAHTRKIMHSLYRFNGIKRRSKLDRPLQLMRFVICLLINEDNNTCQRADHFLPWPT